MTNHYDKVYGCLLAAAIGDAMGCPLETRTVSLIKRDFGNGDFVYDYMTPLPDSIAYDMPRAYVTDDFSCAYLSGKYFAADNGRITRQAAADALLEWKNSEDTRIFYERYCGPSTRQGLEQLEGKLTDSSRDYLLCNNRTATNGGGMKGWIVGLFDPGNVDKAIDDALVMCQITHYNPIALSGAAAVAAAVSQAMVKGARLDEVLEAGMYGAGEGYRRAQRFAQPSAGASVEKRMDLAIQIGLKYANDFEKCVVEMTDLIVSGLNANESIPCAFGYLAAGGTDVMRTIYMAVNSGNDSDTTAIMAGAMAGALNGSSGIDSYHAKTLKKANPFIDFEGFADEICRVTN